MKDLSITVNWMVPAKVIFDALLSDLYVNKRDG